MRATIARQTNTATHSMPTWNDGDVVVRHDDHDADRGERREHGRPDELQVVEDDLRQPVEAGRQQADRPGRVGDREHQDRSRTRSVRHRSVSLGGSRDRRGRRARRASRSARPTGVPSGRGLVGASRGTSSPTSGPTTPPATMPTDGLDTSATATATAAPTIAATSSRRPVMSPTARPIIAAGKMTSMPSRAGSGICAPRTTPADRREVPRDERRRRSPRSSSRARRSGRAAGNG